LAAPLLVPPRRRPPGWIPAVAGAAALAWAALAGTAVDVVAPEVDDAARWSIVALGLAVLAAVTVHGALRWGRGHERRVQRTLRAALRRYGLLSAHLRDIILVARRGDGRILDANAAADAAYGWTHEELLQRTVFDLRTPEAGRLFRAQTADLQAGGARFETEHRRRDGSVMAVEVNAQGAVLDGDEVIIAVVRDISERRATEEALRRSEEYLAIAIDAARLGWFHGTPGQPLQWSERCREIYGVDWPVIETQEQHLALVHPDDREAVRTATTGAMDPAGSGRIHLEHRIVRPDGAIRWIGVDMKARFAEVGGVRRPVWLAGAIQDITETKAVQAQLMQSDRLASVGLLAAGVAHEINNPLAFLSAAIEFLEDHAPALGKDPVIGPELLRALAEARAGAERVRHVVRDLRTFSGVREEHRTRLELAPVLESSIHMASNEIRYRARLVRDLAPAPAVMADEARLGQVALNLLINAAHAIPEGQADRHEIRVATSTDARGRAVFEVSDTGPGIPPEIAERIFDPFFTTKPRGVGTGLGLSICRNIVVGLGGEIAVDTRPGGGTTLRVALPPAPAPAPAPAAGAPPAAAQAAAAQTASRRGRVLVVDDEPAVASAVRRALASQHEVVVHGSAEAALRAVEGGERFDVIVCDLMMPGMTGMDLHEVLARTAPDLARRLVVLTGGAFTPRAREFLDRVPLPRCDKPFELRELRELVRKVMG
jgi:PAS domain S-box-containing protein